MICKRREKYYPFYQLDPWVWMFSRMNPISCFLHPSASLSRNVSQIESFLPFEMDRKRKARLENMLQKKLCSVFRDMA